MLLERAELTASGRPLLRAQEVEILILDKVDLEFQPKGGTADLQAEAYKGGYVVLTSQRVIWLGNSAGAGGNPGVPCWLPVHSVQGMQRKSKLALGGTKVRLLLDVAASFERKPVSVDGQFHQTCQVQLRCRGDGPEPLMAKLQEAMKSKPAPAAAAPPPVPPPPPARAPGPAPGGAPAGHAAAAPPRQQQAVVESLLRQLVDMGFPRNRAARSLLATGNAGCQQAIDYMLAYGDQPGMDDPVEQLQPASTGYSMAGPGPGPGPAAPSGYQPYQAGPYGAPGYQAGPYSAPGYQAGPYGAPGYQASPYGAQGYQASEYGAPGPQEPRQQYGQYPPQYGAPAASSSYPSPIPFGVPPAMPYGAPPATSYGAALPATSGQYGPYTSAGAPGAYDNASAASGAQQQAARPGAADAPRQGFGVTGIVRREEQKSTEAGRNLGMAFQDLQALMGMAADMVKLAERFRGVVSQAGQGNEDELMDQDTQMELIAMGISSPVTKDLAGARYSVELCRQLADFLAKPLQQSGGIMTLPDVYCLYNRARGTELVSPDDLLDAIKMFGKLGLPLKLRNLPSGLPVVQSAEHSDAKVCARIAQLVAPTGEAAGSDMAALAAQLGPGITATNVAKALAVSLSIAREYLLTAEQQGLLCRDDGPEGLRFYNNFFLAIRTR